MLSILKSSPEENKGFSSKVLSAKTEVQQCSSELLDVPIGSKLFVVEYHQDPLRSLSIINQFKGDLLIVFADPQDIWFFKHINRPFDVLTEFGNLEATMKLLKFFKAKVQRVIHAPFHKWALLCEEHQNNPTTDLIYMGQPRPLRLHEIKKWTDLSGFGLKTRLIGRLYDVRSDFPSCEVLPFVHRSEVQLRMSEAVGTIVLCDPIYKSLRIIPPRLYEAQGGGCIPFVPEKYKDWIEVPSWLYVRDVQELASKLLLAKDMHREERSNLFRTTIDVQELGEQLCKAVLC